MPYEPIDVNNSELSFGGLSLNHSNLPLKPGIIRENYSNFGVFSTFKSGFGGGIDNAVTTGCRALDSKTKFKMRWPDGNCSDLLDDPFNYSFNDRP